MGYLKNHRETMSATSAKEQKGTSAAKNRSVSGWKLPTSAKVALSADELTVWFPRLQLSLPEYNANMEAI